MTPRKSGKTSMASALLLTLFFVFGSPGGNCVSVAADTGQAALSFDTAKQFIIASELLTKRSKIYTRSIYQEAKQSHYKVMSGDANLKHGLNIEGAIIDEIHCHKNRNLYDTIKTSMASQSQPLLISITTAGIFDEDSICYELYKYANDIKKGIIKDDKFYGVIYSADADDDFTDPKVWKKCQPNLGVSVSLDYYKSECERAKQVPSYENTFRQLLLSQWVKQNSRWINLDKWESCKDDYTPESLHGCRCYGGLDLSSVSDITAFTLYFPDNDNKILIWFWVPKATAENEYRRNTYAAWARQGWIKVSEGDAIDYDLIRADIVRLSQLYSVQTIAYDPFNATMIATQLNEQDGIEMIQHRTGLKSMNEPSKALEVAILNRDIKHRGNPVMSSHINNVSIISDNNGCIRPVKNKANSQEKIDGVISLILAKSIAGQHTNKESIYETRGALVF